MAGIFAALVALLVLTPPTHAQSTNTVVASSPEDGATRDTSPDAIIITFAQELGDTNTVQLSCEAEQIPLGEPEVGDDRLLLTVPIPEPLGRGTCAIRWQVTNVDGEPNGEGIISFAVTNDTVADIVTDDTTVAATTVAPATTIAPATGGDAGGDDEIVVVEFPSSGEGQGPVWLGRLFSTLSIAILFGSLVLITSAWPEGVEYLVTIRFLRVVWFVAILSTVLFTAAATAASTGRGLGSSFSPATWIDLMDAGWGGRAVLARLAFTVAAGWVAFRPDRAIDPTTQIAGLGIPALAVVTTGISRTGGDLAAIGLIVNVVHVLAVAVWVGGVILLARVVLAGPGEEDLVHAVRGFGRTSVVAIVVTVASGVAQLIRLDGGSLFDNGHGRVLLLKTLVVAVMIFLAITARQFVAQRLARAQEMSVPLADRLRRAFGAEAGIGVVAMGLSAWLLALSPPNIDTTPQIPYAVETTVAVPEVDLEVGIKLTDDDIVGPVGLEVEVRSPEAGITGLQVVFTAPPNQLNLGTVTQPVPLTGPGVAVRYEAEGLPLSVAGVWELTVQATVNGVSVESEPQELNVLDETGSLPTVPVTFPPQEIVTLPPETTLVPIDN